MIIYVYDFGYSTYHNEVWFVYGWKTPGGHAHSYAYEWTGTLGM